MILYKQQNVAQGKLSHSPTTQIPLKQQTKIIISYIVKLQLAAI